jgi:hypothetical protein
VEARLGVLEVLSDLRVPKARKHLFALCLAFPQEGAEAGEVFAGLGAS